jgi:hypothetical protein
MPQRHAESSHAGVHRLIGRITSAMAYPILLIVIGTFAIVFLMVFFIPRFSEIFKKMGDGLPMATQIVMAVSFFMRDYWMFVFMGLAASLFGWKRLVATAAGRRIFDRLKIRIPLFGDIVKKNAVSRFTRTFGTLLKSGVAILSALDIAKAAMASARSTEATLKNDLKPYLRGPFPLCPVGAKNDKVKVITTAGALTGDAAPTLGWQYNSKDGGFICNYSAMSSDGVTAYDKF